MTQLFALVKEPASWWPVKFAVPADGGKVSQHTLELKFARLGIDEFNRLWMDAVAKEVALQAEGGPRSDTSADIKAHNRVLFDRCVRGWRGIVDGEGSPLPFAEPYISDMLDVGNFPEAFGQAYVKFWYAIEETVLGNSVPSPDGGQAMGAAAVAAATETTGTQSRTRSGNGGRRRPK